MTDQLFDLLEDLPAIEPVCSEWREVADAVSGLRAERRCDACDTDEHGVVDPERIVSVVHLLARARLAGFPPPLAVYSHCGSPLVEWHFGDNTGPRASVVADFYQPGVSRVLLFAVAADGTRRSQWYSVAC